MAIPEAPPVAGPPRRRCAADGFEAGAGCVAPAGSQRCPPVGVLMTQSGGDRCTRGASGSGAGVQA
jgi:hypothetical protein